MLKIRRSYDRLIFHMGIPIPGKDGLYTETGPCRFLCCWQVRLFPMIMPCALLSAFDKQNKAAKEKGKVITDRYCEKLQQLGVGVAKVWTTLDHQKLYSQKHSRRDLECGPVDGTVHVEYKYWPGVGVTKKSFVNSSTWNVFSFVIVFVRSLELLSYLTLTDPVMMASLLFMHWLPIILLTHLPRTKWPPFRRRYFQMYFREWKVSYFNKNFTEVCSIGYNWQ